MTNRLEDISSDDTVSMGDSGASRIMFAHYHLRAAACRIASDCERVFAALSRPGRRAWREAAGDALVGSRHLLVLTQQWVTIPDASVADGELVKLAAEIREPQERISQAMTTLLAHVPTEAIDELVLRDARAILETTIRLGAMDGGTASATGGTSQSSAPRPGPVPGDGKPATRPLLLVVDDDAAPRRALSRLLNRLGYEVEVAANGREGLVAAESRSFDLILTDITMPEMDGFELLKCLKNNDATRNVPVIMVSGLDDLQSVVRCIEQGAEDHLTKPYETILLQARVRAVLERKRMRDVELEYLARVAHLSAAAEAVERGTFEPGSLQAQAAHDDELGRLARVFDRMVSGLRSREEQLQHRLRELRREIRQSQRPARVSESVSDASPFAVGDILADRYEVLGELGAGGMGMVYLARDRELGEEVAMKVVRRDLVGQDPTLVERLKSEIRLARRISHRNVVRAHDMGEWHGVYFLTMEYVKGISVAELLQTRGQLTIESTLAIAAQLADALAVAHEQQIIHRDIKPANLLVDEQGVLKVMDFGLARLTERADALTQAGYIVGTPRYMAPEQLFGGDVDGRSDLFAVGVVLYECLTGRPPFDASSPMAAIAQVIEGRIKPIRDMVPDAPPGLVTVIESLLQREPKDRPKSARELADQIGHIGQGSVKAARFDDR